MCFCFFFDRIQLIVSHFLTSRKIPEISIINENSRFSYNLSTKHSFSKFPFSLIFKIFQSWIALLDFSEDTRDLDYQHGFFEFPVFFIFKFFQPWQSISHFSTSRKIFEISTIDENSRFSHNFSTKHGFSKFPFSLIFKIF